MCIRDRFWAIAGLGVVCLAVARWVVPVVPRTQARSMQAASPRQVLTHTDLLRLNFGVFVLHMICLLYTSRCV